MFKGGNQFDPWQLFYSLIPVPFVYIAVTAAGLQFCCIFFNTLVFIYYSKLKEVTRPYILSLIAFDLILCLVPLNAFVVALSSDSRNVAEIAFSVSKVTFFFGFAFYLYPSFFLAWDRFLVILLPFKFKEYSGKVRMAKIVWFSIHLMIYVVLYVLEIFFDQDNILFLLTSFFSVLYVSVVTFGTFLLYVIMVVNILRSSKKIIQVRATRCSSK